MDRQAAILANEAQIVAKNPEPIAPVAESDAPAITAVIEPEAPAPEAAKAAPEPDATTEPATPPNTDAASIAARKRTKQDRIDKLTRQKTERDREIGYLRAQLDAVKAQQPAATAPPAQQYPQQIPGEPTLEQFDYDQTAFQNAHDDWRIDRKFAERELRQNQQAEQAKQQAKQAAFMGRLKAFEAKHPGAWEEVSSAPINTTDPMLAVIAESDIGPEIAYYLAQHVDEANAISQMSPYVAAAALGRIESKLTGAPAAVTRPPLRNQPPPPPPQIAAGSSGGIPVERMTLADHEAAVQASRRARR
jgi:hypothetical protein